jgi:hypothetical protein
MEKIEFTLPEFVFLDGNSHKGDTLKDRMVIQHIRSYTIIEVVSLDEMKKIHLDCRTFPFEYKNKFGVVEKHLFALHFTMDNEDNLPEIFERCREWYCNYLTWEDTNIIEDQQSKFN